MQKLAFAWLRTRYLLLCLVLFSLMAVSTSKQNWAGDFWEHSAVVNELSYNPITPRHSIIAVDEPHPLFSPYALFWGLFTRAAQISAIKSLSIAGILNLILFLTGLYLFISTLDQKRSIGIAYYSLLLILLFWGSQAWDFSGFFHLRVLGYVLPYPSTFAAGLALVTLWINNQRSAKSRETFWLPILLCSTIIILTHQFTFIFLASGMLAQSLCRTDNRRKDLFLTTGNLVLAFLLAALWPYYSILRLLLEGSVVYDISQKAMYEGVLWRTWPVLLGAPLLYLEVRTVRRQPLVWMIAILATVYLLGAVFGAFRYGRVISYLVILLDIVIAKYLLWVEQKPPSSKLPDFAWALITSTSITLLLILLAFKPFIQPALDRSIYSDIKSYDRYYFLAQFAGHYTPIMADPASSASILIPTFAGKLVGVNADLPFVPDAQERLSDSQRFFDPVLPDSARQAILDKYSAEYVLLEKTPTSNWKSLLPSMKRLGKAVYQNKRFILYAVRTE